MFCKVLIVGVFVILLVDFGCIADALKTGDEGVCEVKTRVPQTRRVSYKAVINKWCGRRQCVVRRYKNEVFTTWSNRTVCCFGWEHNANLDICVAACSTGCKGGKCIAPDKCYCQPPLYLDPELKNECLTPKCEQPCVNADCWTNNTCECHQNYTKYNATHCYQCNPGYTIDEELKCTPKCDRECVNGYCSAPNRCTCHSGYSSNGTSCEPVCESCINSKCVSPNVCSCLAGFVPVNRTACRPKCDSCDNGSCVGPNNCVCNVGYENVGGACMPTCAKTCVNGFCSGVDVCSCNTGYFRNESEPNVCFKACDKVCNGTCDIHGDCFAKSCEPTVITSRQKCPRGKRCPPVYKTEIKLGCCDGWEFVDKRCIPQCEPTCVNGTCVDANVCQCTPPLILKNHACVAVTCDPPCLNGECVDDNTCKCNPGTTSFNRTHCAQSCPSGYFNDPIGGYFNDPVECQPRCEKPCTNSICTAPDTCSCLDGYHHMENDSSTCVPECYPACVNGECVAPGVCSCSMGYTIDSPETPHICKPVCTNCVHGDCMAPETCKCHKGYSNRGDTCMPDCSQECVNGICSEPNKCSCILGYQIDPKNEFYCEPICKNKCVNASCVAPNKCACLPGHVRENKWSCKPKCLSCKNGECVDNKCRCNKGYSKKGDNYCSPDCKNSCIRGECTAPDVCTCGDGYALEKDGFTCNPICEGGCINATCDLPNTCNCLRGYERSTNSECKPKCISCMNADCVAPNTCRCHEGYRLLDGICVANCRNSCVNGKCTSPDKCTCEDGYTPIATDSSICIKPCEGPCDFGKCTEHGECICDMGYEQQNGTCVPMQIIDCSSCNSTCEERCVCEDLPSRPTCISYLVKEASSTSMAGLQLTWMMGAAVGLLLLVLVIVVIQRIWTKRQAYDNKAPMNDHAQGSVIYTVPDTLMRRRSLDDEDIEDELYEEMAPNSASHDGIEETCENLLAKKYGENESV